MARAKVSVVECHGEKFTMVAADGATTFVHNGIPPTVLLAMHDKFAARTEKRRRAVARKAVEPRR